jgi:hypothetical protein
MRITSSTEPIRREAPTTTQTDRQAGNRDEEDIVGPHAGILWSIMKQTMNKHMKEAKPNCRTDPEKKSETPEA